MENEDSPKPDVPEAQQIGPDASRSKIVEAAKTQQNASAQLQQVERELSKYERSSLRWMALTVIVYTVTCGFIALQWHEMKTSSSETHTLVKATQGQALIALRELEFSQRPWLKVDFRVAGPFTFDEFGDAGIRLYTTVKNTGHSPAVHIVMAVRLGAVGSKLPDPSIQRQRTCDKLQKQRSQYGEVLFPGDIFSRMDMIVLQAADVKKAMTDTDGTEAYSMSPAVFGCVDYRFGFESGHHQTQFIYWINGPRITPRIRVIPKSSLSLIIDPRGGLTAY